MKRKELDPAEASQLYDLVRGGADNEALGDFAERRNLHRSTLRSLVASIRSEQDRPADDAPPIFQPSAVADHLPPATLIAPAGGNVDTIIHWLTTLRAMRDELRQHGVRVEGRVTITVEL